MFGTAPAEPLPEIMEPIERKPWGELQQEEEEPELNLGEPQEEIQEVQEQAVDKTGLQTPSGLQTPGE